MEKILIILACIFTALCWVSLCLDWDILMYCSGIITLIILCFKGPTENSKNNTDSIQIKDRGEEE